MKTSGWGGTQTRGPDSALSEVKWADGDTVRQSGEERAPRSFLQVIGALGGSPPHRGHQDAETRSGLSCSHMIESMCCALQTPGTFPPIGWGGWVFMAHSWLC